MQSHILVIEPSADYELLDSGEGQKLERFGQFTLCRPDPQALWHKRLSSAEWTKADGEFTNAWDVKKTLPDKWQISYGGLKFWIRPSSFKHIGLFPEQLSNWDWIKKRTTTARQRNPGDFVGCSENEFNGKPMSQRGQKVGNAWRSSFPDPGDDLQRENPAAPKGLADIEILNLFGYTGGATLAAAQAGAKVVHVDGSKVALTWARENAELSGLADKPVRWILDDAHAFVKREIKRGRRYHGIVMDPPAFGHGPKNELWKIENDFLPLIDDCLKILADQPLFFLINGYSSGYSAIAYENVLRPLRQKASGVMEIGELVIEEAGGRGSDGRSDGVNLGANVRMIEPAGVMNQGAERDTKEETTARLLPCGIFARWSAL